MTSQQTYYECHITMEGQQAVIETLVSAINWKFSAIAGDIVLGNNVKCYATRHYNSKLNENEVLAELLTTADKLSNCIGIKVIRRKIERVIYDDRSSKIDLNGKQS